MTPTTSLPRSPRAWYWGWPHFLMSLVGFVAAIVLGILNGVPLHIHALTMSIGALTAIGITLGFHRYFTHRSFETYKPLTWLLAILGSMAGQGSLFFWVTEHRKHHRHSDSPDDPHSPNAGGFWHAHLGWVLRNAFSYDPRLIRDLTRRRDLVWIDRHLMTWYLVGLFLPAVIAGAITGTAYGALMGLLWGGLLRLFVTQQVTFAINSVAHRWGGQAHATGDGSRNNVLLGVVAMGEGWHNNHHAYPYSARHGMRWWQIDLTWYIVWMAKQLGLAWKIRLPKGKPGSVGQSSSEAPLTPGS